MIQALSTAEVVALTGLEERRVRKDVEYGVVDTTSPPRFELPDVVYFRALVELGLELDVEGRRLLHERIARALRAKPLPRRVPLSSVLELKLKEIVEVVTKTLARFEAWKGKLVQDDAILGGEPVFPKSRLAVRQNRRHAPQGSVARRSEGGLPLPQGRGPRAREAVHGGVPSRRATA